MIISQYPTEEQLDTIREWDYEDPYGLMNYIKPLWNYSSCGYWEQRGGIFKLLTAGWSGNEDIITALNDNVMFWLINWHSTTRGGQYIFKIDKYYKNNKGETK